MKQKGRAHRSVLPWIAAGAVLMVVLGCSNPVFGILGSKSLGLVGPWKNTNVSLIASSSPPLAYNLVLNADGTFRSSDSGSTIVNSGTYTVDSVTTQGSTRTYQIHFAYGAGMHCYALVVVTNSTTYETNGSGALPYPAVIDPTNITTYSKYSLQ